MTSKYGFVAVLAADLDTHEDERPTTPPDGEEEFTDDDGTTYKWDRGLRAWVPQVDIFGYAPSVNFI